MGLKKFLKKILYLCPTRYIDKFYLIYNRIFYSELTEKKMTFGSDNEDKTFYVIRPRTNSVEGLMALLLYVMQHIGYAERNNYIPVVDFKNYEVQYTIQKGEDAWKVFFEQISNYTLNEVYKSKNVILSGLNVSYETYPCLREKSFNKEDLQEVHKLIKKYIKFSDAALAKYKNELSNINPKEMIGLYLRGTDYTKLKPTGEAAQPTVEEAIERAKQYMENNDKKVFLVTEDEEVYKKVVLNLEDKVVTVSFDRYIKNYSAKNFLAKDSCIEQLAKDAHTRGMNYLVKIMLLSQCSCIVGGKTCGSWAACALADEKTKIDIFELGNY